MDNAEKEVENNGTIEPVGDTGTKRNAGNSGNGGRTDNQPDPRNGDDSGTPVQPRNETRQSIGDGGTGTVGIDDTGRSGTGNGNGNSTAGSGTGKRKPGRPAGSRNRPKSGTETRAVPASIVGDAPAPKPRTRARRSSKITGEQVEKGVVQTFGLVAMFRGKHWNVDKSEVTAWSNDAAELLNKIPASAFDRFVNISSVVAVSVGMGGIVVPRAMADMAMAKTAAALKKAQMEAAQHESEPGTETVEAPLAPESHSNGFGDLLLEGF